MIKAMTYNVKNGGQDEFDYGRLALVMKVIAAERPDLLVLQELLYAELRGHRVLHEIESELAMRAILGQATTGQHVAVLVRMDARVTRSEIDSFNFHHATVRVDLDTSRGTLTLVGTHLCPHGGANRLGESQRLANAPSRTGWC